MNWKALVATFVTFVGSIGCIYGLVIIFKKLTEENILHYIIVAWTIVCILSVGYALYSFFDQEVFDKH